MVAVFNSFLAICLVIFSLSACAREDNQATIEDEAFDIAHQRYQSAKQALEAAIKRCEKERKSIPSDELTQLGLSLAEMKVALFVLNTRAEARCENGAREVLFYTAAVYRATAKHYGKDPEEALLYNEENMLSHIWKEQEFEAQYQRIDKETRDLFENIKAAQVPFDIFKTLDELDKQ